MVWRKSKYALKYENIIRPVFWKDRKAEKLGGAEIFRTARNLDRWGNKNTSN